MNNILTLLTAGHAAAHPDAPALAAPDGDGKWHDISWREFDRDVCRAARALARLGVGRQDCVATFSANRPENLVTDFALYRLRAVSVSIYATSSPEQVTYIVDDAKCEILFAGNATQYHHARTVQRMLPGLRTIVVIKPIKLDDDDKTSMLWSDFIRLGDDAGKEIEDKVEALTAAAEPDDIATLVYTSGTTGEPKGAILTHHNYTAALEAHKERLTMVTPADVSMAFLPLSHIFEKGFTYFCLVVGAKVAVNRDPHVIQDTIKQVRPTCMCAVPRFWEKVYTAIQDKFATIHGFRRWFANWALKIGKRRNIDYVRLGNKVPWWLEMRYRFAEQQLFKPLQRVIGVENGNIFPTAGAPLSPKIAEFFHTCGINVMIGYGLSETTATVTCFPRIGYEFGTVGTPIPNVHVKIAPDGEILVKGPTVMKGYHRKPEATAEAFTPDGWFRTGDAGYLDKSGALVLTERLKDLFKTSNGKYIAPQALESRLGEDRYIEQVATIGDRRKFVSALIVPDYAALRKYAAENGISFKTDADLAADPRIYALIEKRIDTLLADLAPFERIKRFRLLSRPFTMENGELTNTLKIRRPVIAKRYADLIDSMYAD